MSSETVVSASSVPSASGPLMVAAPQTVATLTTTQQTQRHRPSTVAATQTKKLRRWRRADGGSAQTVVESRGRNSGGETVKMRSETELFF